jgi:hypothetical protein
MVFRISRFFVGIWRLIVVYLSCCLSVLLPPPNSDYFCRICKAELPNSYYHCMGCETLMSKDLNLCWGCINEKKYFKKIIMTPGKAGSGRTDDNHIGYREVERNNKMNCLCKQSVCQKCKLCRQCSCKCHHEFERRCRFYSKEELRKVLKRCNEAKDTDSTSASGRESV